MTTPDALARFHLAAIVDSADDAIVSKTLDGIIRSWNVGAERMFGYTAAEAIGRPVSLIIPVVRLGEEVDILARIGRGERVEHFETVRSRKDGALLDVSLTISPIRNDQGEIIGASKIARDIGARRRADEAACHLAAIVTSSDDAIVGKTLDGIIRSWNAGAERIFGYPAGEVIGRSITIIPPPRVGSRRKRRSWPVSGAASAWITSRRSGSERTAARSTCR